MKRPGPPLNSGPGLDNKPSGIWPVSSPISNISIDKALALKAGRHEAILVALFEDSEHWHDWQHSSARLVAWMDSIPGDQLLVELFGYSEHRYDWHKYNRQIGESVIRGGGGARNLPPQLPPQKSALQVEPLVAERDSAATAENTAPRLRKSRRPTLTSVSKQASRAGIEVARYEIKPDGTVVVVTGKSEATEPNPWLDDLKVTKQ
jgi:hypothetical protein